MAALFLRLNSGCLTSTKSILLNCKALPTIGSQCTRALFVTPVTGLEKMKLGENFFDKNIRMHRPMSPHLTIYQPQLTALLSVTHRGTGMALSGMLYAFAFGMLVLPSNFPHYIALIQSFHFGWVWIMMAKFCLAWPFMFHMCNGIRHLFWDAGYGFHMPTLYKTGYLVLFMSWLMSFIASVV